MRSRTHPRATDRSDAPGPRGRRHRFVPDWVSAGFTSLIFAALFPACANMTAEPSAPSASEAHAPAHGGASGEAHAPAHGGASGEAHAPAHDGASGEALEASPIDIPIERLEGESQHEVTLHYRETEEHLVHQQHTIEIEFDEGSEIEFDGHSYSLDQFHFHTPSEHLIGGVRHPVELHLVHHDEDGHVLVLGVLFEMGAASPLLERIITDSPRSLGRVDLATHLDVNALFPPNSHYFGYKGSFTTPPYSEGVQWLILKSHPQASAEQIVRLLVLEGGNARDVQPLNDRQVEGF